MNTHTLCFCPLIRKLQAFEILNRAQGINGESRGHPISPMKYNLYFHCNENKAFLKHALYLINTFLHFITLYIINANIEMANYCHILDFILMA